jgi:Flp pilus assembly protein TadG
MRRAAAIRRHVRRQDGQVIPILAVIIVALILMAGLVIDLGRVWVAQRKLQGAVDAAALVAGQDLPNASTAYNDALAYSAVSGDKNAIGGYGVTGNSPSVTFECVSHAPNYTAGSPPTCPSDSSQTNCDPSGAQPVQPSGAATCNAVKVAESATVKTTFLGVEFPSFNVTASSTAAARGGIPHPVNAFVILDNTNSMEDLCSSSVTGITSSRSAPEKLDCAKAGMRTLLQTLWPCASSLTSCGSATANGSGQLGANVSAPADEVGLLVFPAISGNPPSSTILKEETDCKSSDSFADTYPTYSAYTYSSSKTDGGIPTADDYSGYEAVGLSSDYRPSVASSTLNATTSSVVEAVDWGQCSGGTYPGADYYGLKDIGGQGSYLAGAITEAQHLLNQNARAGAQNAIIVESDGQLNDPKTFTDKNPCTSAINAATQAKAAGTTIYAIAYGSNGTECPDTSNNYTDVETMEDIATSGETFFNEPTAGDLTAAFGQVGVDLSDSDLIPDCTQAPPNC